MSIIIDGTNGETFPDGTVQSTSAIVGGKVPYTNLPTGNILQVVSYSYAGETSTTSTSFTDTPLTVSITPKFATSKIFVIYTGSAGNNGSNTTYLTFTRNGTNLSGTQGFMRIWFASATSYSFGGFSMSCLDSPATTSSLTYKVQFKTSSGTTYVSSGGSTDTITVMEIAG
jgi:hypothetical protein